MLLSLPWIILPLIIYNIVAFTTGNMDQTLATQVLPTITLISEGEWTLRIGDCLILLAIVLLFVEILKATRVGGNSLIDHALSTVLFIIALIEFLVVKSAATSTFFIIMVIMLVDVVAGFSVTLRTARRDIGFAPPV